MIPHARRASVLVAFALLASAATGYGASEWVVWMHSTGELNGAPVSLGEQWERFQSISAESESQCLDARAPALSDGGYAYFRERFQDSGRGVVVRRDGTTIVISWRDSDGLHTTTVRYEC